MSPPRRIMPRQPGLASGRLKTATPSPSTLFAHLLTVVCSLLSPASAAVPIHQDASSGTQNPGVTADQACSMFLQTSTSSGRSWRLEHCIEVWTAWVATIPKNMQPRLLERNLLRDTSRELQRLETRCVLKPGTSNDGAGSSAMRTVSNWMFAEALGCDWVDPVVQSSVPSVNGTALYCHEKVNTRKRDTINADAKRLHAACSVVNWTEFFRFDKASVELPLGERSMVVRIRAIPGAIRTTHKELASIDSHHPTWDHLLLEAGRGVGALYTVRLGWEEFMQGAMRSVLSKFRRNFHSIPRPGHDGTPMCAFDSTRMNFAMHVRMGDREMYVEQGFSEYFEYLEAFMDTVTRVVEEDMGRHAPLFHVFSETMDPCPNVETGVFDEFPEWPVQMDQIAPCLSVEAPSDCPEKRAGLDFCPAKRSGVFRVEGRDLILHVGSDTANDLECMIEADGLLMGCSTFGQIAGMLSKGVRLFSTACDGDQTARHYKLIPPLAIAEGGRSWVPITGSWRDPVLLSDELLKAELENTLGTETDGSKNRFAVQPSE